MCVCTCEIDVLVNNAGRSQRAFVIDSPLQIDRDIINVNVVGPISLTKCVLPHMVARRHGYLLVTSSVTGKLRKPSLINSAFISICVRTGSTRERTIIQYNLLKAATNVHAEIDF